MNHSALTPVFTALRLGLHVLFTGLTAFVIVRSAMRLIESGGHAGTEVAILVLSVVLLVTYAGAGFLHLVALRHAWVGWLVVLTAEYLALLILTPDAAYLLFPLFFLYLHLLNQPWSMTAVGVLTMIAVSALAWHDGVTVGGILGPFIGAAAAVAIGLGYRALFREAHEREELIRDLVTAQQQLAEAEREAGVLAERARLAREIHDTVAQGLSSIQLLLHAAEREDAGDRASGHIRLARETAATNLAEARRFIRELTPATLTEQPLASALTRLADRTARTYGSPVHVTVSGEPMPLPMPVETALLRIAQGSLANAAQHARANQIELTLSYMERSVSMDVVDDGVGFDADAVMRARQASSESFGLTAIAQRAQQLGGSAVIESTPGAGTAVAVSFPIPADDEEGADR